MSGSQLQDLFACVPSAILCLDHDFNILFANRSAIRLTGTPDLIGKNIFTLFPGNLEEPFYSNYQDAMAKRIETGFEAYYPEPLNTWFKATARPFDAGIAIFFDDITERRLSEEEVRTQQELLSAVQQGALVATWSLDPATERIVYGQGSYPVFGHPLGEIATLSSLLAVILPEQREQVLEVTRTSVKERSLFTVEFEVFGKGGERISVECRGQVLEESGKSLRIGGIALDTTARKLAADALLLEQQETERQRAEIETIYRTAEIGLALFSAGDFRYLRINDRQAQMIGLPSDQIVGRTLTEIAPDIPGLLEIFRRVEAGAPVRDLTIEGELPARPGEARVWSVSFAPVFGHDGSVEAIAAASLEVTNQKRAEAALLHSEKLAAVGRLASSISHEINNPLEAVTNLLYIIGMHDLPDDLSGYLTTAQEELARVSQIATQTLRFHRQASKPTEVTPAALVGAVLDLYHGRLLHSGVKVETNYCTDVKILCFENDLRQVLNNLIANAIDAMEGGGRLIARAHASHDPQTGSPQIRITIADTGHGMSRATQSRIFDPFFTTKELNGTGLGLWISTEIVQRHHGNLRVRSSKSRLHRGTVFTLVLPCDRMPEEAPNPSAYSIPGAS